MIVLKERAHRQPLLASREFSIDGEPRNADLSSQEKFLDDEQFFVIDGQQRLQSFYIGLCGSYGGKQLYFDLYSKFKEDKYEFKFADPNKQKISTTENNFWYPVKNLFEDLSKANDADFVSDSIIDTKCVPDDKRTHVERNIRKFYDSIFKDESIGISRVTLNKNRNAMENRQRMVELFQRINREATRLNPLDFVASRLKGFDSRINQDELIKLIMTLQDKPLSEVTDLDVDGKKICGVRFG